nr:hypothetical protein GCM10020093_069720 [Planobispora longispora]
MTTSPSCIDSTIADNIPAWAETSFSAAARRRSSASRSSRPSASASPITVIIPTKTCATSTRAAGESTTAKGPLS